MMPALNAIYVLVARELKKLVRARSRLVSSIARPILWLFLVGGGMGRLVGPMGGMTYTQFIFPGILGMTILFSAIFSSISIIWDKEFGFLKEILVAPIPRYSIVVGKALSGTAVSSIQAAIVLMCFPLVGMKLGISEIVSVFLICVTVSFAISAFGIVLAIFFDSYESFTVIMNFIVMPMFFLSGAMYPVKLLPEVLQWLARLNPLTYGIDALKHIMIPASEGPMNPDFPIALDLGVIAVLSLVFVIIGAKFFEKKA